MTVYWPAGIHFTSTSILSGIVPSKGLLKMYKWPHNMHQSVLKWFFWLLYHIMYEHHHFISLCHNTGQIWLGDEPIQTVIVWSLCHFFYFLMLQSCLHPSLHNTHARTHTSTHTHKRKYVGEGKSEQKNKVAKANMFLMSQPITMVKIEIGNTLRCWCLNETRKAKED